LPRHVDSRKAPRVTTAAGPVAPSTARSRATWTVVGGDSLPWSPGWYGTCWSSVLSICMIVTGSRITQPGSGRALTTT
jgi:hypothetical protein